VKHKSIGFKIGVALAVFHLCLTVLAFFAYINCRSSTAGLVFVYFFVLDAPILLLLPSVIFKTFGVVAPLIQFGIFGSALWFLIPWLIDMAITHIFPNGKRLVRAIVIVGAIPIILAGFSRLSNFSTKRIIQQERPAELKKMLNSATSDFLTEKVIFEIDAIGPVTSINRMICKSGSSMEIIVAMYGGIVFLNESYQEQSRLNLAGRRFNMIEPLYDNANSCWFLAYRYGEGVYLFDLEGKEIWKFIKSDKTVSIDGSRFGDVDGDGKMEFAIYYRYRQGIALVDSDGKTRWEHPVDALGHLEITDILGDGKARVVYTNSNNANGRTDFIVLDSEGTVVNQQNIATKSCEFAVIRWPNSAANPNILLTEDGKIRIVDIKGETVVYLDAPGCRPYGNMKAVTVKFKKEEPEYLAVRKILFPDLAVLYVYDANGKLVYQKTEVFEGLLNPALAAMPVNKTGTEKLLMGASAGTFRVQVLEYSLTR
jgi:hypothetical protein